jgi:hypothetical protein
MNLRIKTGSHPGDVSKQQKEAMLEGRVKHGKTFKKVVRLKERAVLKERARKQMQEA